MAKDGENKSIPELAAELSTVHETTSDSASVTPHTPYLAPFLERLEARVLAIRNHVRTEELADGAREKYIIRLQERFDKARRRGAEQRKLLADRDELVRDYEDLRQNWEKEILFLAGVVEEKNKRVTELEAGLRASLEQAGRRYDDMSVRITELQDASVGLRDYVARLERLISAQEVFCEQADDERGEAFRYAENLLAVRDSAFAERDAAVRNAGELSSRLDAMFASVPPEDLAGRELKNFFESKKKEWMSDVDVANAVRFSYDVIAKECLTLFDFLERAEKCDDYFSLCQIPVFVRKSKNGAVGGEKNEAVVGLGLFERFRRGLLKSVASTFNVVGYSHEKMLRDAVRAYELLLDSKYCFDGDVKKGIMHEGKNFVGMTAGGVPVPFVLFGERVVDVGLPVYVQGQEESWRSGLEGVLRRSSGFVDSVVLQKPHDSYHVDLLALRSAAERLSGLVGKYVPTDAALSDAARLSSALWLKVANASFDSRDVKLKMPADLLAKIRSFTKVAENAPYGDNGFSACERVGLSRSTLEDVAMKEKVSSAICAVYAVAGYKTVLDGFVRPVWRHSPIEYHVVEPWIDAFAKKVREDYEKWQNEIEDFKEQSLAFGFNRDIARSGEKVCLEGLIGQEFNVNITALKGIVDSLYEKGMLKRRFSFDGEKYVGSLSPDAVLAFMTGVASKDSAFGLIDKDAVRDALMYDYQYSKKDPVRRLERQDADNAIKMLCDACEASRFYDQLAPVLPSFLEKFSRDINFPGLDGTYISPYARTIVEKAINFIKSYDGKTPAQKAADNWVKTYWSVNSTYEDFKREFC